MYQPAAEVLQAAEELCAAAETGPAPLLDISTEEVPRPVVCASQQHQRDHGSYIKAAMQAYSSLIVSKPDPDAASLVALLDHHMQTIAHDAVEHLLSVKAIMMANLDTAIATERDAGSSRLAAKEAEVDILKAQLKDTQKQLNQADGHLQRVCDAYAAKQELVVDTRSLLSSWHKWRAHIARQRRLARQALRAEHYYVHRWLLGRAWDRWAGRARSRYRQLTMQRAEQQREAETAALTACHAQKVDALKGNIEALQQRLQQEAAARNKMEEEMKRAFMRGVTAINLEAVQIMRRGAPPSGANPFPITVPLDASTATAGLAEVQQQHQQHLGYQMQQQEQQQLQQESAEQAEHAALAAMLPKAHGRSPGSPSCCSLDQAAQGASATLAPPMAPAVNSGPCHNLATWTSVPATAAAGRPVSNSSSSGTIMAVPQAQGASLPKVVIERGPAAAGSAKNIAAGASIASIAPGNAQWPASTKGSAGKAASGAAIRAKRHPQC